MNQSCLLGFACKVKIETGYCVANLLPFDEWSGEIVADFIKELVAFRQLKGTPGISQFVGVMVDDKQQQLKGYLRNWQAWQ